MKNKELKAYIYNITPEELERLYNESNQRCQICGRHESELSHGLTIDHCHTTGKVRGLLCQQCNNLLGIIDDNISLLVKAIQYLKNDFEYTRIVPNFPPEKVGDYNLNKTSFEMHMKIKQANEIIISSNFKLEAGKSILKSELDSMNLVQVNGKPIKIRKIAKYFNIDPPQVCQINGRTDVRLYGVTVR